MNNRDNWLQISTTVAVLIGIALVVIELQQNSDLVELQILKQDAEAATDRGISILPDNIYEIRQKSIDNPEDLTHLEFRALDGLLWYSTVNRWRGLYDLAEQGLLEDEVWRTAVKEEAPIFLAYPFGRAYWERMREVATYLPADFVVGIDEVLANASDNYAADSFSDVMERLETKK